MLRERNLDDDWSAPQYYWYLKQEAMEQEEAEMAEAKELEVEDASDDEDVAMEEAPKVCGDVLCQRIPTGKGCFR